MVYNTRGRFPFTMDSRKRAAGISNSGGAMCWPNSFLRQPARVLVMDAMPPWWSETCTTLCEALDNFLSLACSLDGPCRIPLLSIYAVSRQQECLLPFVQVRGNLGRLRSCVEELRSIPDEGCIRGPGKAAELLRQAVLDSLQQFKQYSRHINGNASTAGNHATGNHATSNASVEVTVVTSQPGRGVVKWLEAGLKGADLVSLRRLLVVHISTAAGEWSQGTPSPENTQTGTEDNLMLGTDVDLQQVDNTVVALETMLKAWLHEQGGDREHLHLMLPSNLDGTGASAKPCPLPCDPNLAVNTESVRDFQPPTKSLSNHSPPPQTLRAIKLVRADAVCESVLYGLPLVIRPTNCWQLDWDDMEMNHNLFHALCHMLRSREVFLLVQVEPVHTSTAAGPGVYSFYILQSSDSLTLLLKPVVSRELLLPFSVPVSNVDPQPDALQLIQGCLGMLDEDFLFNPLSLSCNLYQHLRNRALVSRSVYPYRLQQSAQRDQPRPLDGTKTKQTRQPRQAQSQGRQLGANSRVRATIAPLPQPSSSSSSPSSSSMGPPPNKASRPTLTFLGGSHRAPMSSPYPPLWKGGQDEDDDDNDDMIL